MKDRFDLEQQIIRTSEYASQIRDLIGFMSDNGLDEEKTYNALIGIAEMIDIHTDKMYDIMCEALQLNKLDTNT